MRRMSALVTAMSLVVAVSLTTLPAHAQPQSSPSEAHAGESAYSPDTLAKTLRDKTQISPRLPTLPPDENVFFVIREVTSKNYDILLATVLPCEGGNACLYGSLQASRSGLEKTEGKAIAVTLRGGTIGQFIPARCQVFCSQAYIRWKEGGVFYSIGMKAGRRQDLIRAANSCMKR